MSSVRVAVPGGDVSVAIDEPDARVRRHASPALFVLGHGAGGSLADPLLVALARAIASRGHRVVRFNFLYSEARRRLPDPSILLESTWRGVLGFVRAELASEAGRRLIIGGKSMGGRMATHLAVAGEAVDGIVLFGYPLHPARRPDKLRAAHLAQLRVPTLFVSGSRDALCDLQLLRPAIAPVAELARLHVIEGADHALALPRRSGTTLDDTVTSVVDVVDSWLARDVVPRSRCEAR